MGIRRKDLDDAVYHGLLQAGQGDGEIFMKKPCRYLALSPERLLPPKAYTVSQSYHQGFLNMVQ